MVLEGESDSRILNIDDDNNNGMSRDWIRVPISICKIKKA